MSKFADEIINKISPYVPGEQPKDRRYIKLNTNENPYYTSQKAVESVKKCDLEWLNRYSDPESSLLTNVIAEYYNVKFDNVLVTNGSDEALAFCFYAFGRGGVCYPDITYGFYDVIANLYNCPIEHIPLNSKFRIEPCKYFNKGKTIVIANPNAQTGILLDKDGLESIIKNNAKNIVIVDGAYSDFSGYTAIELTKRYKNLICVNTFSKSRSLAGARVGYVIAHKELIEDLKKVKNSFHPYNVNSISSILAAAAISDDEYFKVSVAKVKATRQKFTERLLSLGFDILPSEANFVLARCTKLGGEQLYLKIKQRGALVRYPGDERIKDYVRITIGTDDEMNSLINIIECILTEN